MPFFKWERSDKKFSDLNFTTKCWLFFGLIFMTCIAILLLFGANKGMNEHVFFDTGDYYVSEVGIQAPAFFLLPFPVLMMIGIIQKIFNYKNEKIIDFIRENYPHSLPKTRVVLPQQDQNPSESISPEKNPSTTTQ